MRCSMQPRLNRSFQGPRVPPDLQPDPDRDRHDAGVPDAWLRRLRLHRRRPRTAALRHPVQRAWLVPPRQRIRPPGTPSLLAQRHPRDPGTRVAAHGADAAPPPQPHRSAAVRWHLPMVQRSADPTPHCARWGALNPRAGRDPLAAGRLGRAAARARRATPWLHGVHELHAAHVLKPLWIRHAPRGLHDLHGPHDDDRHARLGRCARRGHGRCHRMRARPLRT